MFKNVIGIRTNDWTVFEQNLYNQLHQVFSPEQIFIIVDETTHQVEIPSHIQKISWDNHFIERNKLLDYNHFNKGVGWLCGDYFYYAFKEQIKSEYYWLIEPDVALNFENLKDFFSIFEDTNEDALLARLELRVNSDYWFKSANLVAQGGKPYGCLFPLIRLSANAIDACLNERKAVSQLYIENQAVSFKQNPIGIHFPNDESLVATTLIRDGFKVGSLNDLVPNTFDYFRFDKWFSAPQKDKLYPQNSVIHPIRDISSISSKLSNEIISSIEKSNILNYTIINLDNIELVASQVGKNVSKFIEDTLNKQIKAFIAIDDIKTLIKNEIKKLPISMKLWLWEDKTLILETISNANTLAVAFYINDGAVTCFSFNRGNQTNDWVKQLEIYYPQLQLNEEKAILFNLAISNKQNLNTEIKRVIHIFYRLIESTYSI